MKGSPVKLRKTQRKTNYTWENENSLDSLASNIITVITQIVTFFLNLGTTKKNVKKNKYSPERSFRRNKKKKKKVMSKFFRKTLRSNLKAFSQHQNRTFTHYVLFEHFIHAFNQNSIFISSIQNVSLKKIETAFLQNIFTSYKYIKLH